MKHLVKLFVLVSVLGFFAPINGFVADRVRCLEDLQLHFFRQQIVFQALSNYIVPQGLWTPIYRDLVIYSAEVPDRMKQISIRMVPNPLEYPLNRLEAARILKMALYQVCVKVLRFHYITEHPTIEYIFDYIFAKESGRLIACFGEEVKEIIPYIE